MNISKNGTTPLDLMYVETPYMTRVCVVSITWGLIADIDIGSEAYRKLGEKRFTITAIDKIAKRQVNSHISFLQMKCSSGNSYNYCGHLSAMYILFDCRCTELESLTYHFQGTQLTADPTKIQLLQPSQGWTMR